MMQCCNLKGLNINLDSSQWPEFSETELSTDSAQFTFIANQELIYFSGHFPQQAVLPGVVQVHWAGELARHLFACEGFSGLSRVKFNAVILPNAGVKLSLKFRAEVNRVDFCYEGAQQKFSSGVLSFQEAI